MSQILEQFKSEYEKAIEYLENEIATIKTGRATPLLVENIRVESYGAKIPLNQLANIGVPDARCILIEPWDKNNVKEIEKAIVNANVGLNPVNEGDKIRIVISQLTEEDRMALVKILHQKIEKARIAIRVVRDKVKENIIKMEKDKEIAEDDKYRLQKELDEMTSDYNAKVKEIGERKEGEINTI